MTVPGGVSRWRGRLRERRRLRRRLRRSRRPEPWVPPTEEEGYRGAARLVVGTSELAVDVHLTGHLEPLDGRYHWYGRVTRHPDLAAAKDDGATEVTVAVPDGTPALARLAEYDAWGNLRLVGTGAPPYPLEPVELGV